MSGAPNKELQFNMPKQLRDQLAAADALREQLSGTPPAVETPASPQEATQDAISPPVSTPQPPAPESAPASPTGVEDTIEQKYNSLRGRHEQLQRSNSALSDRIASLETLIANLQAGGAQPPQQPAAPAKVKLLTEQEEADYGEDMLTVVGKKAREEFAPEFEQLANRLKQIENRVEGVTQVTQRTEQQKMYDTLDSAVPDWQDINVSPEFDGWLSEVDPFAGRKRKDMLLEAFTRQETSRVVNFFKGYAEATGTPTSSESPRTEAPPLNNGSGQKPSLADFAAPGRARSAPQELTPDKPIYTTAWIAKFMADKLTGKYKGREAEVEATERDIFQAQHEGRIQ